MKIQPINDENTNYQLVYLDTTPHCKIHGAMNKVNIFPGGAYWRCISSVSKKSENNCRAGCLQEND